MTLLCDVIIPSSEEISTLALAGLAALLLAVLVYALFQVPSKEDLESGDDL